MTEGVFRHKDIKIDYARVLLHPSPTGAPSRREPSLNSPLPDDTKNVSVSQKNGGSKPPPYREIDNFVLSITIWHNSIKKPSPVGEGVKRSLTDEES